MIMSWQAFQSEGYLQEVNRCFLHPLGLALAVQTDENGVPVQASIIDSRHDPEGMAFPKKMYEDELFQKRKAFVTALLQEGLATRRRYLGFGIQPCEI
jgi:hypothetical protein